MPRTIAVRGTGKCSFAPDTIQLFADIERRSFAIIESELDRDGARRRAAE